MRYSGQKGAILTTGFAENLIKQCISGASQQNLVDFEVLKNFYKKFCKNS